MRHDLPHQKESEIQRTILDFLTLKKVFHYRQNNIPVPLPNGGFRPVAMPGLPDIVAVVNGRYVGIEVKTWKGKQSEAQLGFEAYLRRAGGVYLIARSIEDVDRVLTALSHETEAEKRAA